MNLYERERLFKKLDTIIELLELILEGDVEKSAEYRLSKSVKGE